MHAFQSSNTYLKLLTYLDIQLAILVEKVTHVLWSLDYNETRVIIAPLSFRHWISYFVLLYQHMLFNCIWSSYKASLPITALCFMLFRGLHFFLCLKKTDHVIMEHLKSDMFWKSGMCDSHDYSVIYNKCWANASSKLFCQLRQRLKY